MAHLTTLSIDREPVSGGDAQLDNALFAWARTKLDVGGCQSLDDLLAIAALGERFHSRPLSQLPIFDRVGALMVGFKTITCEKCRRVWHEPLREKVITNAYGEIKMAPTEQTVQWCSHCLLPKPLPVEGDTFRPGGQKRIGRGKLITIGLECSEQLNDTEWQDGIFTRLALKSWCYRDLAERSRINRQETLDGENLYSPDNLAHARAILQHMSLGQIMQRWPWLSREDARKGKAAILSLSLN